MKCVVCLMVVVFLFFGCVDEKKEERKNEVKEIKNIIKSPQEEFEELVAKKKTGTYKVNLNLKSIVLERELNGSAVVVRKGTERHKIEISFSLANETYTTSFFETGEDVWVCIPQKNREILCVKITEELKKKMREMQEMAPDIESEPSKYKIEKAPNRMLAGTTASCFKTYIRKDGEMREVEYCYSSEGYPLFVSSKGVSSEFIMRAENYTSIVSDEEFKLPGRIVSSFLENEE